MIVSVKARLEERNVVVALRAQYGGGARVAAELGEGQHGRGSREERKMASPTDLGQGIWCNLQLLLPVGSDAAYALGHG